jgi:CSLREA domain-containing protein
MHKTTLTQWFVKRLHLFFIAALLAGLAFSVVPVVHAADITVDTLTDENDHDCNDGDCSLRDAIETATAGQEIDFSVTGTITLTGGQLTINKDLTITGPGADQLTISGNNNSRVFRITLPNTVTISGLTIADGDAGAGGGILNHGYLTLNNCIVSSNTATNGDGGGILNGNHMALKNCTVSGNTATNGDGGGINSQHGATITKCTVSGNTADDGGGIYNDDSLKLTNCTVSGNTAEWGGGIYNDEYGDLTLNNCTITDNTADFSSTGSGDGGGLRTEYRGTINVKNSIIAGNGDPTSAPDCSTDTGGSTVSGGYNLVGKSDGCNWTNAAGDQVGTIAAPVDPQLGPLADNGGPTETHALLTNSPALDQIPPIGCTVTTDQRGVSRPQPATGNCDIGALEAGPPILRVSKAGSGDGTVTGGVAGINCGADCAEWYDKDTVVTLTAIPDVGFVFTGWSGDCDANGQVTMDADKTCTATFNQAQPPVPVGGIVVPVNRLELLSPWMGLAALASLAVLAVTLVRRRKNIAK